DGIRDWSVTGVQTCALPILPFGGAGPLHGGSLARLLGIPLIVVPATPGVLSAHGLLVSDLKAEFARTSLQKANAFDAGAVARLRSEERRVGKEGRRGWSAEE